MLVLIVPALAESTYGTVLGTFTDPSGSVVPGAKRSALTDRESGYTIVNPEPYPCAVTVQAAGFQSCLFKGLQLQARQTLRVEVTVNEARDAVMLDLPIDRRNNLANFLPDHTSLANGVTVRGTVVVPDSSFQYLNPDFAASITPTPIITVSRTGIPQSAHYSLKTGFAPRIGFPYRPFGDNETVVRGGYGRFIETLLSALITSGWAVAVSEVGSYTNTIVNGKPTLSFPYAFPSNLSQSGVATFEYSSALHYALHYKVPYLQQWNLTVERDLGAGRADAVIGVPAIPASQTIRTWVNPAAFAVPANNTGHGGNSGPGTQAVSLSLFKTTRIAENANLHNAFNHPNYGSPALNLSSASTFGTVTSLQSQENGGLRSLQLTGRITF